MPRRWNKIEEKTKRDELYELYVRQNKTLKETAATLHVSEGTVYDRLLRLGIPSQRHKKPRYNNQRQDIKIPEYSPELAEVVGALLGDGCINPTQVTVTLGIKDRYVEYISELITRVFGISPKNYTNKYGHTTVYFGSTVIVRWLLKMGLTHNKVRDQVDIPQWIFTKKSYMRAALRGLFDTDGSVYKLRWGMQISFCNRSRPLSVSVRSMLQALNFNPSRVSGYNLYLTRATEIDRFFKEIGFGNQKHITRFQKFKGASYSGN